jgi:hypothetical protein
MEEASCYLTTSLTRYHNPEDHNVNKITAKTAQNIVWFYKTLHDIKRIIAKRVKNVAVVV